LYQAELPDHRKQSVATTFFRHLQLCEMKCWAQIGGMGWKTVEPEASIPAKNRVSHGRHPLPKTAYHHRQQSIQKSNATQLKTSK